MKETSRKLELYFRGLDRAKGAARLFAGCVAVAAIGCGGASTITTGGWDGAIEAGSTEASLDSPAEASLDSPAEASLDSLAEEVRIADGPSDSTADVGDESPGDAPADAMCPSTQTLCAGMCTNTSVDPAHCGACTDAC